jgi:tripartite ATP-independent transporter DctM subunit
MSIEFIFISMFGLMMLSFLTGQRIFIIIGAIGAVFALFLWGPGGLDMVFFATYSFMKWYVLIAIPPFIFMGVILARSGLADDLYEAIYKWMGPVRGGLAMGTIGICAAMAAMIGENISATVATGLIGLPSMLKRKYNKLMVTGAIQAGGALGFLIPPSLVFILYGLIARVSIGQLWLGGVFPGLLLATMHIAYIGIRCYFQPHLGPPIPKEERATWGEKFRSLRGAVLPVLIIFLVLGLLFMGLTSLVECAAIGAVGALGAAALHHRLNWKLLVMALDETLKISCMFMWIIAAALLFSAVFDGLGTVGVLERLLAHFENKWMIISFMMFSWIVLGCVMDDTAMLIIVAPLYVPIVAHLGFSLVWFGVLYVVNCQMAYLTPPFGYNLFIMRGIAPPEITMGDIYRSVVPFVGVQFICLIIVMIFPQIALWLPSVVFAGK